MPLAQSPVVIAVTRGGYGLDPLDNGPTTDIGSRGRLDSVDLLRGAVMILMALDHTRDYFGDAAANPTNLATASTALFLTRWVTHFCAPVFFLLTGTGAYLSLRRRSPAQLSRFLLTRGLWLVLLELTLMRALWQFNIDYRVTILNVIWALGWSMVALAAISRLPFGAIIAVGVGMIGLHNSVDSVAPSALGALAPLWMILHRPGPLLANDRAFILLAYPLIPWIGVTAVGFALGRVFAWPAARRRGFLLRAGGALIAAFAVLRATNVYGDPARWAVQTTPLRTVLSFVNTTKYPPSLLFLLMTLGPALVVLGLWTSRFDQRAGPETVARLPVWVRPVVIFGRVPFFYYLLHVALIHGLAVAASAVRFHAVHWMFESPNPAQFPVTQPPGWPAPLPWVYLAWVTVLLFAYPCCRWFAAIKGRRADSWLRYV